MFTQILLSYCPRPNPIQGSSCLVHSSNEPRRCKNQRDRNGIARIRRSGSAPDSLHMKQLCGHWILVLGEIMEGSSLHSAAFKEIKGPPAWMVLRHSQSLIPGCQEQVGAGPPGGCILLRDTSSFGAWLSEHVRWVQLCGSLTCFFELIKNCYSLIFIPSPLVNSRPFTIPSVVAWRWSYASSAHWSRPQMSAVTVALATRGAHSCSAPWRPPSLCYL